MLDITGLHYRYPRATGAALSDVSLSVKRGQILGLLGLNGAGKSTLVGHLAGLLPVQHGEIRVDGERLHDYRRRDPTRIAVAPQDYAFYPMLSARENLNCFAAVNRLDAAKARRATSRALAVAQLNEHAEVRGERLSGGLKRRLSLAIALLADPQLIVLDEPTVGVDAQSRAFLLEIVKRLAADGAAVIYTSHYLEEIEAIADQVAILDHGRVLRHGPLDSLLAEGAAHLMVGFSEPPRQSLLDRLHGVGVAQVEGTTLRLQLAPGVSPLAVLELIAASGAQIAEIHAGRYTLERLFMQLTSARPETAQ
jgi:ABC-2 type transport system ATP-binding protein